MPNKTVIRRGPATRTQQKSRMKIVMRESTKYRKMGLAKGPALKKAWRDVKSGKFD